MTDPLRDRDVAAVRAYRDTGAGEHLELLRMDGLPRLAHALTMERVLTVPEQRARHTAQIEAWLAGCST